MLRHQERGKDSFHQQKSLRDKTLRSKITLKSPQLRNSTSSKCKTPGFARSGQRVLQLTKVARIQPPKSRSSMKVWSLPSPTRSANMLSTTPPSRASPTSTGTWKTSYTSFSLRSNKSSASLTWTKSSPFPELRLRHQLDKGIALKMPVLYHC